MHLPTDRFLLSEAELASILGISRRTLQSDRYLGRGLPFVRMGGRVYYPRENVEAALAANVVTPRQQPELEKGDRKDAAA